MRRRSAGLVRPCSPINKINGDSAKLLPQFFTLILQRLQRDAISALQFVVQPPPVPGTRGITGKLSATMNAIAVANARSPGRRRSFEPIEKGITQAQIWPPACNFSKAHIGFSIGGWIHAIDRVCELSSHSRGIEPLSGELKPLSEDLQLIVETQQLELLQAYAQNGDKSGSSSLKANQLSICPDIHRLLGHESLPAKTEALQLLLQWDPDIFMPTQAILDGRAELYKRVLNRFSHLV